MNKLKIVLSICIIFLISCSMDLTDPGDFSSDKPPSGIGIKITSDKTGRNPGDNDPGDNDPGDNDPGDNDPGNNDPGNNDPGDNEPGNNDDDDDDNQGGKPIEYPIFSRDEVINDMFATSEGVPAGIPNYIGWKNSPRVNLGIKIPADWNAVLSWGQVYAEESSPNPDKDFPLARVHIKDLQIYFYYKDGTWELFDNVESPGGDHYVESFSNNTNKPAQMRRETGGGVSIQAGSGWNFHYYGNKKRFTRADEIAGVFVVCKARLIGYESYDTMPKYVMNMGADWWRNTSVQWAENYANNDDIAIGRFKKVTPEWRYFTMHTFTTRSEAQNIVFPLE